MRREDLTLDVSDVAWLDAGDDPEQPTLTIRFDGPADALLERLARLDDEPLEAAEMDVTLRLRDGPDDSGGGVVAVTDRVTGDYVLEINADAERMMTFIAAARRYGERTDGAARYRVRIEADDATVATYEKRTLLVYSRDGELLRERSLIPSGVEI